MGKTEISISLYNKLNNLGLLPNNVRESNVGESDYFKHTIQPWSIWIDYNLNPWDADIIKRVLRTKEENGESLINSRIKDYKKIKHICDERIRQLSCTSIGFHDPKSCDSLDVEDLEVPTKELSFRSLTSLDSLSEQELSDYITFCTEHSICHEPIQINFDNISGIGRSVKLKCPVCGEEKDITDVSTR